MIAYTTLACAAVLDLTIYFCRPNVLSPKWPYTWFTPIRVFGFVEKDIVIGEQMYVKER